MVSPAEPSCTNSLHQGVLPVRQILRFALLLTVLFSSVQLSTAADWLLAPNEFGAKIVRSPDGKEISIENGLVRRTFRLAPNGATVAFDNLMTGTAILRGVKPEASIVLDGTQYDIGGLKGQPNYAFLKREWIDSMENDPKAFQYVGLETGVPLERLSWLQVRHHAPDAVWPPKGVSLRMDYESPEQLAAKHGGKKVRVSVHYELYDGIPCLSKWIAVHNGTEVAVNLDRFISEIVAAVEYGSHVEHHDISYASPTLHVETDFAFGGFKHRNANYHAVRWLADPDYKTQVNYLRQTPCLLNVSPSIGPDQTIEPGGQFESFRTFVMAYDSTERERQGLALRRMYRTIAPWVTENPLMMHVRRADWDSVKLAIDQCAEVGFEMVILTFGSGFNIENDSEEYLAQMKKYADYAKEKNVEIGGYSLLASRRIQPPTDNVIDPKTGKPGGGRFGNAPALASKWGQTYFAKLRKFYDQTGFKLLEHDGSYPGDVDASSRPPLQKGVADSQWVQWRIITDFYKRCRAQGIYLNVPDYYYLAGSNKCGMGYRETNWSLPRAQQVIHTRQNIYDGTWQKTPSMGWMFVPLTQYHGGGAAATVEPLDEHLDHYENMIVGNLGAGVQACYRGPRLYDTDRTKAMLKGRVDWYRRYRTILESDIVHGSSRRADGRDLDWVFHANAHNTHRGMLVVHNPLAHAVQRTIKLNLYYTGLDQRVQVREQEGEAKAYELARDYTIDLPVSIPAGGMSWFVFDE